MFFIYQVKSFKNQLIYKTFYGQTKSQEKLEIES